MPDLKHSKWTVVAGCAAIVATIVFVCLYAFGHGNPTFLWLAVAGAALILAGALRIGTQWLADRKQSESLGQGSPTNKAAAEQRAEGQRAEISTTPKRSADGEHDPADLVEEMLRVGRHALLLRPQIASNMARDQLQRATELLDETMGIVPEGDVLMESWSQPFDTSQNDPVHDRIIHVDAMYLDRHLVTNREYQHFVDDGGYERISLWDSKIWPAVLDFVDQTGYPGPRFWREGRFPAGLENHPVVGVSWYEAAAYARWVGKRMPSDPEWVKAGSWPVLTSGTRPTQRVYPWGDTMEPDCANIWGVGPAQTSPVGSMPNGVSVGGIYDLIGNVWEWTSSEYGAWDTTERHLDPSTSLKSLRGGAFDTYFQTQATCQFQSGESPINRKHNIGFRCALAMCDVVSDTSETEEPQREAELAICTADAGEK